MPVTSPLQAAHDQAAGAAEPIVCTVATPRRPVAPSVYTGAELLTRCNRPGAYDALALPSLQNGRQRLPGDQVQARPYVAREIAPQPLKVSPRNNVDDPRTMTREFPTVHHPRGEYRPHAGSTPAKVLDYLRAMGGFISHAEICERFDIKRSAITAAFKPILKHGVLVRQVVDGYTGFSLPGRHPPAAAGNTLAPKRIREPEGMHIIQTTGGDPNFLRPDLGNCRFWPIQLDGVTALTKAETTEISAFLRALPKELGYRPPGQDLHPDAAASSEFTPDQLSALYALSLREAELGLLLGYLAVMQLRKQFADCDSTYPFPPLTEPPRLTDAA